MLIPQTRYLPWPLPAVLAWAVAWAAHAAARPCGAAAFGVGLAAGCAVAAPAQGWRRRAIAGAGFPLSAAALGAWPSLPAWAWLCALLPLALAYPVRAWRDAPFFPTPAAALRGLDGVIALAPTARVLDAGCGLGHGLAALRRLWPQAQLHGIEWSRPLAFFAARRCRHARIVRGDMWAASWTGHDVVYLFQRPESMARAWAKAEREIASGWLVSLEFEVPGRRPTARLGAAGARPVWVYRIGPATAAISGSTAPGGRR